MNQTTKPDIWPIDKPLVVYMVPAARSIEYSVVMSQLTARVLTDLGWSKDAVEFVGLISASPQHGTEGICFLEDSGVDTRAVSLLMLWGDTSDAVSFEGHVSEECGIGRVILPHTGAMIPTVRMPSIDTDWWREPIHQEYAVSVYTNMIRDGRYEMDGSEPFTFVHTLDAWN